MSYSSAQGFVTKLRAALASWQYGEQKRTVVEDVAGESDNKRGHGTKGRRQKFWVDRKRRHLRAWPAGKCLLSGHVGDDDGWKRLVNGQNMVRSLSRGLLEALRLRVGTKAHGPSAVGVSVLLRRRWRRNGDGIKLLPRRRRTSAFDGRRRVWLRFLPETQSAPGFLPRTPFLPPVRPGLDGLFFSFSIAVSLDVLLSVASSTSTDRALLEQASGFRVAWHWLGYSDIHSPTHQSANQPTLRDAHTWRSTKGRQPQTQHHRFAVT